MKTMNYFYSTPRLHQLQKSYCGMLCTEAPLYKVAFQHESLSRDAKAMKTWFV